LSRGQAPRKKALDQGPFILVTWGYSANDRRLDSLRFMLTVAERNYLLAGKKKAEILNVNRKSHHLVETL